MMDIHVMITRYCTNQWARHWIGGNNTQCWTPRKIPVANPAWSPMISVGDFRQMSEGCPGASGDSHILLIEATGASIPSINCATGWRCACIKMGVLCCAPLRAGAGVLVVEWWWPRDSHQICCLGHSFRNDKNYAFKTMLCIKASVLLYTKSLV